MKHSHSRETENAPIGEEIKIPKKEQEPKPVPQAEQEDLDDEEVPEIVESSIELDLDDEETPAVIERSVELDLDVADEEKVPKVFERLVELDLDDEKETPVVVERSVYLVLEENNKPVLIEEPIPEPPHRYPMDPEPVEVKCTLPPPPQHMKKGKKGKGTKQ